MGNIFVLLQCLSVCLDPTTLHRLCIIALGTLAMTGRVTMLGISRWTGKGGSYRTVERFFNTVIDWSKVHWTYFLSHLYDPTDVYIAAGDEVVVTKSGKKTHGLDKYYSSLFNRVVPGLCFFVISIISVKKRKSFPILIQQIIGLKKEESKKEQKPKKPKKKRGKGRPKGSKNKNKEDVELSPYFLFIQSMIAHLLELTGVHIPIVYMVLDGAFGNNYALQMVKRLSMDLISKLRYDSALYFPYTGKYSGKGRPKKYGKKLDYNNIPKKYLKESKSEDGIRTDIYQMQMLHKRFPQPLNIVIIVKTVLESGKRAHVILFSSDLKLTYDKIIEYYCLRFQIEFNFRDAKQYWGLEDFMNIKETPVTNSVNLSFFMCNLAYTLLQKFNKNNPKFSILDLKARYRAMKYIEEILKLFPETPDSILIQEAFDHVSKLGSVNVK
jgi:putative transposase